MLRSIVSKASCLKRSRRSLFDSDHEATPPEPVFPPARFWKSMLKRTKIKERWRRPARRLQTQERLGKSASQAYQIFWTVCLTFAFPAQLPFLVHVERQTQSPLNCAWVAFVVTSSHKKMGKDKRSVLEKYMEAFWSGLMEREAMVHCCITASAKQTSWRNLSGHRNSLCFSRTVSFKSWIQRCILVSWLVVSFPSLI